MTETVSWDRSWIHPQSLALLTKSLVGRAPNGIQIGASVTVEFGKGGKTTRLASSSAKSGSLAASSQQNSTDTVAPSKPTPGSAARGGPVLFGFSASRLYSLSLGLGSIILWAPPNIWLIGIHRQILKNLLTSFNWISNSDITDNHIMFWYCQSPQSTRMQCSKNMFFLTRMILAFAQPQNLSCHYHYFFPCVQIKPPAECNMFIPLVWWLITGILGNVCSKWWVCSLS